MSGFVVRKLYRESLIILAALLIIIVVWLDTWVIFGSPITFGEKSSAIILLTTALIVFWYTRETYDLKQNSNDQLKMLDRGKKDEFLPVIIPENSCSIDGGSLNSVNIKNVGKGVAKNISIKIQGLTVLEGYTLEPNAATSLAIIKEELTTQIEERLKELQVTNIDIAYKDIYNRGHRTAEVRFTKDNSQDRSHFIHEAGSWKFIYSPD